MKFVARSCSTVPIEGFILVNIIIVTDRRSGHGQSGVNPGTIPVTNARRCTHILPYISAHRIMRFAYVQTPCVKENQPYKHQRETARGLPRDDDE